MSAVPSPKRLGDEELEILGSRYLDGDLSPEEKAEFEAYLARDPQASAKVESLQAVVEELRSLPAPDTPFAMSTRVAARVQEQAVGFSGVLLRLGIVRRMGAVLVLMAGVGAVAIYYLATLGGSPAEMAARRKGAGGFVPEKDIEGPVQVFFEEKAQSPEAAKQAALPAKPSSPAPVQVASAETGNGPSKSSANVVGRDLDTSRAAAPGAVSEPVAIVAQAADQQAEAKRERFQEKEAEADHYAAAAKPAAPAAPAPAPPAPAAMSAAAPRTEEKPAAAGVRRADESLASMPAPTAPAMAEGRVMAERSTLAKGKKTAASVAAVSITGPGGKAAEWRLRGANEVPAVAGGIRALYHVTLEEDGRVKKVIRISGPASGADEWLKGARFEKIGGEAASNEVEVKIESRPE